MGSPDVSTTYNRMERCLPPSSQLGRPGPSEDRDHQRTGTVSGPGPSEDRGPSEDQDRDHQKTGTVRGPKPSEGRDRQRTGTVSGPGPLADHGRQCRGAAVCRHTLQPVINHPCKQRCRADG